MKKLAMILAFPTFLGAALAEEAVLNKSEAQKPPPCAAQDLRCLLSQTPMVPWSKDGDGGAQGMAPRDKRDEGMQLRDM